MKNIIKKIENKLYEQNLVKRNEAFISIMNIKPIWNNESKITKKLSLIMQKLDISSMIFAKPKQPYLNIINYLVNVSTNNCIIPNDNETRTFIHSFVILKKLDFNQIENLLRKYKLVIIPEIGILTTGHLTIEQAFIYFSSVCFSCYIKFCTDYFFSMIKGSISIKQKQIMQELIINTNNIIPEKNSLQSGFLKSENEILEEIIKTGFLTVKNGLVDSFFGNISYRKSNSIYITQTGSSLDELQGLIDKCSFDIFSKSMTASSEFATHKKIYEETNFNSILHGHPKFSVIISLLCDDFECKNRHNCYILCSKKRFFRDIPIVVGEIGQGPYGICHSVPSAIKKFKAAIVFGHGVFTTGKKNFIDAFDKLTEIENMCKEYYFNLIS